MHQVQLRKLKGFSFIKLTFILSMVSVGIYTLFRATMMIFVDNFNFKGSYFGTAFFKGVLFYFCFLALWNFLGSRVDFTIKFKTEIGKWLKLTSIYIFYSLIVFLAFKTINNSLNGNIFPFIGRIFIPVITFLIFTRFFITESKEVGENVIITTLKGKKIINPKEVQFIKYSDRKVLLKTEKEISYINSSLNKILNQLNSSTLILISRHVAINLEKVSSVIKISHSQYEINVNEETFLITAKSFEKIKHQLKHYDNL